MIANVETFNGWSEWDAMLMHYVGISTTKHAMWLDPRRSSVPESGTRCRADVAGFACTRPLGHFGLHVTGSVDLH